MRQKRMTKKEVYFIATKYKNKPAQVDFYTKTGKHVPSDAVEKKQTKEGVRFFAAAAT